MQLLTQEIRRKLPELYATDGTPADDKLMIVKFFTPDGNWTWYACEFDGADEFFGYVDGLDGEWGYFSLSQLQSIRGKMGLPVERDRGFRPTRFGDIQDSGALWGRGSDRHWASVRSKSASGERTVAIRDLRVGDRLFLHELSRDPGNPYDTEVTVTETAPFAEDGWVAVKFTGGGGTLLTGLDPDRTVTLSSSRTASRRSAEYQPGAYDEFAGSGGPYSSGEYPDDDPSLPDGYDYKVDSSEPVRPEKMTRKTPVETAGVGTDKQAARLWSEATSVAERASRSVKAAKYAVDSGGQQWDNRGGGFELAGSAWVTLHGDSPFVRWAVRSGSVKQSGNGLRFQVPGKSHDRVSAYAKSMVNVLTAAGVPASFGSEMED